MILATSSTNMDDQVFHLLNSKFGEIRSDLHEIKNSLKSHVEEDRQYWQEIWFVKRLLVGAWAFLVFLAGIFGWKLSS